MMCKVFAAMEQASGKASLRICMIMVCYRRYFKLDYPGRQHSLRSGTIRGATTRLIVTDAKSHCGKIPKPSIAAAPLLGHHCAAKYAKKP